MYKTFCLLLTLFIFASINLTAQNTPGEHHNPKNTIYVLDEKVITGEEYRATSLWKISSEKSVRSKNDPLFEKYAKENTDKIIIASSANSCEESVLSKIRYEPSSFSVSLTDGVGILTAPICRSHEDIVNVEVVKDSALIELFAPFSSGVISITTRSKPFLDIISMNRKTDCVRSIVEYNDKLSWEDKEYIGAALNDGDDMSKWIVVLVDGIEYIEGRDPDLDLNDIESMKLVRDSSLCRLFAPRTGGILKIGTKSKTRLNELAQIALKTVRDNMERAHRTGEVYMR